MSIIKKRAAKTCKLTLENILVSTLLFFNKKVGISKGKIKNINWMVLVQWWLERPAKILQMQTWTNKRKSYNFGSTYATFYKQNTVLCEETRKREERRHWCWLTWGGSKIAKRQQKIVQYYIQTASAGKPQTPSSFMCWMTTGTEFPLSELSTRITRKNLHSYCRFSCHRVCKSSENWL